MYQGKQGMQSLRSSCYGHNKRTVVCLKCSSYYSSEILSPIALLICDNNHAFRALTTSWKKQWLLLKLIIRFYALHPLI